MLKLNKGWLIGGCLMLGKALAGGPEIAPAAELPTPGVSVYGLGGNGWTAIGDVLAPVLGQPNSFFFIDPQFYYHSAQSYTGSAGVGHRWLTENAGILGAYVFGDFNHSDGGQEFWFVSPGLERLGRIVDLSINAYIPVSTQRINTGTEFADQVGDSSQVVFAGHNQYDTLVDTFTSTGYGGDAQIGFHVPFFRNSEVFLGGYYFAPKDTDSIGGGAVRVQIPVNRYLSVIASEAYDSEYHNTLKAGLTVWFGGRDTGYGFNGDLAERLVDPIQRSLIAVAGGSETGEPVVSDFENTGQTALELSNISFFVPAAAPVPSADLTAVQGDGTYENPYQGMTQDNVDNGNAQDNRNFYVNSGTYNAVYGMTDPDYIILNNDQVYGRQNYFKEAAQGDNRALINFTSGGFTIPDSDTYDSITGLRLMGMNASTHAGIWIDHETSPLDQTVTITNTDVSAFGDGIDLLNADNNLLTVNINDSLITQNNGEGELFAGSGVTGGVGAMNTNAGPLHLSVNDSMISSNDKTITTSAQAVGGLALRNFGSDTTLDIQGSNFYGNTVSVNNSSVNTAGGLAVANFGDDMMLAVHDSNFSGNTVLADNSSLSATGGLALQNFGKDTTLSIGGSDFDGNTVSLDGSGDSEAGGLAVANFGNDVTVAVYGSKFSGNTISSANGSTITTGGGLAVMNDGNNMKLNIYGSSLSDNMVSADNNNSSVAAGGGLAVLNESNGMTVDVRGSNFSQNTTSADNHGSIGVGGGLAILNENNGMTVDVRDSNLSQNTTSADNHSSITAGGGLAVLNTNNSNIVLDVRSSNLSQNTTSVDGTSALIATGGLAVVNQGSLIAIDVDHSVLTSNTNGIEVNGSADVDVTRSIIAGNANYGLSALSGAQIAVTNPIFFDGVVNFDGTSSITFPGLTPANGDHVVCPLFGSCAVVTPR